MLIYLHINVFGQLIEHFVDAYVSLGAHFEVEKPKASCVFYCFFFGYLLLSLLDEVHLVANDY